MTDSQINKIEFNRNIDLFLPEKTCRVPSDYQFFSFMESRLFNNYNNGSFSIEPFREFLDYEKKTDKKSESKYDARIFIKYLFFDYTEFINFDEFLFNIFRSMCPDNQLNIKKENFLTFLEKYQNDFENPNSKIATIAKYFWLTIGFKENEFEYKLIPNKESKKIDIQKIMCIHNLCVLFSFKLIFIYFDGDNNTTLKILPVGCLNSDNIIYVALRIDTIKGHDACILILLKPKSLNLDNDMKKVFDNESLGKNNFSIDIKDDINPIYNLQLAHTYLLAGKDKKNDGNLFKQFTSLKSDFNDVENTKLYFCKKTKEATENEFIFAIPEGGAEKASLFSIITSSKNVTILDICFNDKSIYVISHFTNKFGGKQYIQVHEGSIGTQYLDDMYLCVEEEIDMETEVYGKVSLIKSNRINTPIAIYLYYDDKGKKFVCKLYIKPLRKFISVEGKSISNDFYYSSSLQFYSQWIHYKENEFKNNPIKFSLNKNQEISKIDFDGTNVIFYAKIGGDDKLSRFSIKLDALSLINSKINVIGNWVNVTENKSEDDNKFTDLFKFDNDEVKIIGTEMSNLLFLLRNKYENIFYHPARVNFNLKAAIKSAFYRYKENMPKIPFNLQSDLMAFTIIHVMIDVGYDGDINKEFKSHPLIPGIYLQKSYSICKKDKYDPKVYTKRENKADEDDDNNEDEESAYGKKRSNKGKGKKRNNTYYNEDDEDEDIQYGKKGSKNKQKKKVDTGDKVSNKEEVLIEEKGKNLEVSDKGKIVYTLKVAFSNAGMITGKDIHRTKCQVAAAYVAATDFTVYGPSTNITKFKPKSEVFDNWTHDKGIEMLSNLIATYGVLLEMRTDAEFNIALNTLKTTKGVRDNFDEFYTNQFKPIWKYCD